MINFQVSVHKVQISAASKTCDKSDNSEIKECLSQLNNPGAKGKTHSNDGHRICKTSFAPDTNTPIYWIAFSITNPTASEWIINSLQRNNLTYDNWCLSLIALKNDNVF